MIQSTLKSRYGLWTITLDLMLVAWKSEVLAVISKK